MSIPLIAGIAVLLLIAAIAIAQRSRPRITQIDRTIRRKKDEDSE
jgi:hypothetical protein